jgi:hypothetical protein
MQETKKMQGTAGQEVMGALKVQAQAIQALGSSTFCQTQATVIEEVTPGNK